MTLRVAAAVICERKLALEHRGGAAATRSPRPKAHLTVISQTRYDTANLTGIGLAHFLLQKC